MSAFGVLVLALRRPERRAEVRYDRVMPDMVVGRPGESLGRPPPPEAAPSGSLPSYCASGGCTASN
jgi:hypothetical protein